MVGLFYKIIDVPIPCVPILPIPRRLRMCFAENQSKRFRANSIAARRHTLNKFVKILTVKSIGWKNTALVLILPVQARYRNKMPERRAARRPSKIRG